MTKRTRASGSEISYYGYDRAGRMTSVDYPGTADDVAVGYDQASNRTLLENPSGSFSFSYDAAGRLEWKDSTIDVSGLRTYRLDYTYDNMDRLWKITYPSPSNRVVEYLYDSKGWLQSVGEASPSTVDYVNSITYHPSGAPDLTTFANGVTTDVGLDSRYRIKDIDTVSGATTLMDVTIGYDKVSNVQTWTDNRAGGTGARSLTPDNLDRLLTANAASMWGNLSFTYDELGNRKTRTLAGATTTYNYSATTNRLTSLTGAETASFGYDSQGRQTTLTAPDTTPPDNATGISATALTNTSIRVSWTNPAAPDIVATEVYRSSAGFPSFRGDGALVCTITPAFRGSCTAAGLVNGRRYFFAVFSVDEAANVSSGSFASAVADVCPECDKDLMIGLSTADLIGVQNTGTFGSPPPTWQENPNWDFLTASGLYARPALADMDNDGDLDMFVGFLDGLIKAYENVGTREAPQWQANASWQPSFDIGSRSAPAFADFDGDGDLDIMAGNSSGQLEAYRNNGDAENPGPWSVVTEWSEGLPNVGSYAAPALFDTANNGVYHLLVGTSSGYCFAFQNVGTRTAPAWSAKSNWDVPDTGQDYAVPALLDLDGDGDVDVLVGDRYDDRCYAYENIGGVSTIWARRSDWDVLLTGDYLAPAVGDLDHEVTGGIFSDGFESGNTAAWSSAVGKSASLDESGKLSASYDRWSPADDAHGEYGWHEQRREALDGYEDSSLPVPKVGVLADDQFVYTFNAADQLTQASWQHGVIESYSYDGDNLRIKKINGTTQVVYIRDPSGNVIAEYDQANNLLAEYMYANGHQVAKIMPGGGGDTFRFFHGDHLGTALVITNESGAQTWRGEYYPFGEEYSSQGTPNRYRFVEREMDHATGLIYMRARYYDPRRGRFLSVDPVRGRPKVSQSWNRYSYAFNNPLKLIDPDGREVIVSDNNLVALVDRLANNSASVRATLARYTGKDAPNLYISRGNAGTNIQGESVRQHFKVRSQGLDIRYDGNYDKLKSEADVFDATGKYITYAAFTDADVVVGRQNTPFTEVEVNDLIHELGHAEDAARDPINYLKNIAKDVIYNADGTEVPWSELPNEQTAEAYRRHVANEVGNLKRLGVWSKGN